MPHTDIVENFIARWQGREGGQERANYALFLSELCRVLDVPQPDPAAASSEENDYVFERAVKEPNGDGTFASRRIDLYKRGSFVLEAKQSRQKGGAKELTGETPDLFGHVPKELGRRGAGKAWDVYMLNARRQAENYARCLPTAHGWPPFILLCDVGHCIEVYADFSGQGKNFAQFPDRQSFRIYMEDLRNPSVRERLQAIWEKPLSLDPTRISAEVTRDIADRLARIARRLENKYDAKDVAEFLMRCLFMMFAEDVGLIPEKGFEKLLRDMKSTPQNFRLALESLWKIMDEGGYAPHLNATLKRFNGALFKNGKAIDLDASDINELLVAAERKWGDVEPAIFGTLLERALDPRERSKLGAHYTPRVYVERLVVPTIIEPLKADWEAVQNRVKELQDVGDQAGSLAEVRRFHHELCTIRVLDPACGTGNFLYVSLELIKRLEGEVLEALDDLGENQGRFAMEGETVSPRQFYGLELNRRAVPIADLVLWIGYLKWQLKTGGIASITEPVLHAYGTIKHQDAILAYDHRDLAMENGRPVRIWDGTTHKASGVTGGLIPDKSALIETYLYKNPRIAGWPPADFIVGNPPFIGNKLLRRRLGNGYVDALYKAYAGLPSSFDFVSYWWFNASKLLLGGAIRRFGFVTTKSIAQISNRKVFDQLTNSKNHKILFAIPNHPWFNEADTAAVRVAFTVAGKSEREPILRRVISEKKTTRGEAPTVELSLKSGLINSDLTIGVDATKAVDLLSNRSLSFQGCKLGHDDFQIDASHHLVREYFGTADFIRKYIGGDQIKDGAPPNYVIDLYGYSEAEALSKAVSAYQHVRDYVKPYKDEVRRDSHRDRWWIFGEPRPELRGALSGQSRYFATVEVSKHRYFVRLDWPEVLVDGSLIAIASDAPHLFSVLHARPHCVWALRLGGRMGAGNDPRYQNSVVFDRFPFPPMGPPTFSFSDPPFAVQKRLRDLGEQLDTFRRARLSEHSFLTMTGLYNALERLREVENGVGEPLTAVERDVHQAGLISALKEIHDEIDRAVFASYGWHDLVPRIVGKPGATLPSPHKSPDQEAAEEELISRLVALNQERASEEKRGFVRWLRPEFQISVLSAKVPKPTGEHVGELEVNVSEFVKGKPIWPKDGLEQIKLVREILAKTVAPALPDTIASAFDGKSTASRKSRVAQVLETLVSTGVARAGEMKGQTHYYLPR